LNGSTLQAGILITSTPKQRKARGSNLPQLLLLLLPLLLLLLRLLLLLLLLLRFQLYL
jgi:hypothetical protein